jgi:hypothetical protein
MLLSWGGRSLGAAEVPDRAKVQREVVRSVRALHTHGVAHTDVRGGQHAAGSGHGAGRSRTPLDLGMATPIACRHMLVTALSRRHFILAAGPLRVGAGNCCEEADGD